MEHMYRFGCVTQRNFDLRGDLPPAGPTTRVCRLVQCSQPWTAGSWNFQGAEHLLPALSGRSSGPGINWHHPRIGKTANRTCLPIARATVADATYFRRHRTFVAAMAAFFPRLAELLGFGRRAEGARRRPRGHDHSLRLLILDEAIKNLAPRVRKEILAAIAPRTFRQGLSPNSTTRPPGAASADDTGCPAPQHLRRITPMEKITLPERPHWRAHAEEVGFTFADMHGEPYWDESSSYAFTLDQIETDLEDPATELHAMCREAVAHILSREDLMDRLAIPEAHRDLVAASWRNADPEIYGRFDFAYDGKGPAKLLEYNADTPTSLYESAAFQWQWLEDQIAAGVLPQGSDQFNGIHEALVARFAEVFDKGSDLHFTAVAGNPEDYGTVEAIGWAAREAGLGAHYCDLDKIALSEDGQFLDDQDRRIAVLFKLYPWEDLLRDEYARHIDGSGCLFLEPAWKALLSNKGLLPVLWEMFEGHPNLLPAFFEADIGEALAGRSDAAGAVADAFGRAETDLAGGHVRKPILSREGASVSILENGAVVEQSENTDYAEHPRIVQAYAPLPVYDGFRPVVGAWIVGQTCVGIGIREDRSRITQDLSRFKPHYIVA